MRFIQLFSLIVFALIAIWYVQPALRKMARAEALSALLWIHVFRYTVLLGVAAQRGDFIVSDAALFEAVTGDLLGAGIALTAIAMLRLRLQSGILLAWLLVLETLADAGLVVHRRLAEPPPTDPIGVLALVLGFLAPMILVSLPLIVWQLVARRRDPLAAVSHGVAQ